MNRIPAPVARKKTKKHSWRRTLLTFVIIPLSVWFLAFLVWFFWHEIVGIVAPGKTATRPGISAPGKEGRAKDQWPQPAKPAQENIAEEDRKKLDDILKRR